MEKIAALVHDIKERYVGFSQLKHGKADKAETVGRTSTTRIKKCLEGLSNLQNPEKGLEMARGAVSTPVNVKLGLLDPGYLKEFVKLAEELRLELNRYLTADVQPKQMNELAKILKPLFAQVIRS